MRRPSSGSGKPRRKVRPRRNTISAKCSPRAAAWRRTKPRPSSGSSAPPGRECRKRWARRARRFFFGGLGQPQDSAKAFPLLLKAAQAGSANAQNNVGVMLRDGQGVKLDEAAAAEWFRKAAAQGHAKAQGNLGHLLFRQPGAPAEKIDALKWLTLADRQGEVTARRTLAEVFPTLPEATVEQARKQAGEFTPEKESAVK